jgi:peptidoglycan hydrolase-like protein with peptidoglycan-binding domain
MRIQLAAGCALLVAASCAHGAPQTRAPKGASKTPPGQPPLAASPADLMDPGSQQKVARALKSRGFLERDEVKGEQLTSAIRKFQKSEDLAETGFPDQETLVRLGIDPKEIREISSPSGQGGSGGPAKDDH